MAKKRVIKKRRRQRGGMFSMLIKYMTPLHDLGPRILTTVMQMSNDVKAGKNWKVSALERIPETLKQIVAGKPFQLGSGIRRRRTQKQKKHGIHS